MHDIEGADIPVTTGRYHAHVYTVIRVKVAVAADDHRSAMEAADRLLFAHDVPVALVPTSPHIEQAEHADEVVGYLVDEVGDDDFLHTRSYGPNRQPDPTPVARSGIGDAAGMTSAA